MDEEGVRDKVMGGQARELRASAVSSVYSHMVQCPRSAAVNERAVLWNFQRNTHLLKSFSWQKCAHTNQHTLSDMYHTIKQLNVYTHTHTQLWNLKSYTKHIHGQACSSPAFCIGDTFHYSKHLSWDVVCTLRGDMHFLQTRYTLIMHAETTGNAIQCAPVCICICKNALCIFSKLYVCMQNMCVHIPEKFYLPLRC